MQQGLGIDFHFHIRRQYFQAGFGISGDKLLENNHAQFKVGYGYRKETAKYNFAAFAGPTFFTGVHGVLDTGNVYVPAFYQGAGGYVCVQIATKLVYDIGIGAELFSEFNYKQSLVGVRFFLFFSGAYRGVKRNYNPNVRSENKK